MKRQQLIQALDSLLFSREYKDYCPNGLQVEGAESVSKIVTGVTASQALIDAAITNGADTVLVHHGYFWKGERPEITGMKRQRIAALLQHNINLIAYHLPIDAHPEYGNNVQLGQLLGLTDVEPLQGVKPNGIVYQGKLSSAMTAKSFATHVNATLGRSALLESVNNDPITSVAWCTGGGQGYIETAVEAGIDLFLTGEVSEQTIHVAREQGIHFIAAGHHATERYGVKAVGDYLAKEFSLDVEFIDIDNPA